MWRFNIHIRFWSRKCTGTDKAQEIDGNVWLNCTSIPRWTRQIYIGLYPTYSDRIWNMDLSPNLILWQIHRPLTKNRNRPKPSCFSNTKCYTKYCEYTMLQECQRKKKTPLSLYGRLNSWLHTPHLVQYNFPGDMSLNSHNLSLLIKKPEFVTCHPQLVQYNPPLVRSVWCQSTPISSKGSGGYPQLPASLVFLALSFFGLVYSESESGFAYLLPVYFLSFFLYFSRPNLITILGLLTRGHPGTVTIPQYRVNKTKQPTLD